MFGTTLHVRNVNEALPLGLQLVQATGKSVSPRGQATLEVPGPVMTIYSKPQERVLFDPIRDANPFFHFFESLWILAGADTVDLPCFFLNRLADYSDDGKRFHGAYGQRMRSAYGFDQLEQAVGLLRKDPDSRQVIVSIWHPERDLGHVATKDTPCNDMIAFKIREGKLNMTVFNRSNDVIWGAYGANAVQFSVIQEYVAARVEVEIGHYVQVSDSYHVYEENPLWKKYAEGSFAPIGHVCNPYDMGVSARRMFASSNDAVLARYEMAVMVEMAERGDLEELSRAGHMAGSVLFREVAIPMLRSYLFYKFGDLETAMDVTEEILAEDWRTACHQWLRRRATARKGGI
ncbi:MAG: hypothetical protein JZU64_00585 [Rhodoferax sp.]|nr:hypothetical protein [Rhodoferax sp.]